MTLDETIKHCEQIAVANEAHAQDSMGKGGYEERACIECASEHRQLVEWLKELKERKSKCKWIRYNDRTICPQNHEIDNPFWRIPVNPECLKYCPYCGKEIEVTE